MTERVIQRSGVHARRAGNWALNVVLAVLGILMLAPFYWVFITSLLTTKDAFQLPPVWFPSEITVVNYRRVFELIPFWHMALNSLKISGIITLGSVTTSVLAAYAFARLRFPGRDVLFIILLSALMVPVQVTVIPTFILIRHLHLLDTHEAVYLPALINVFGIFLLRQFFLSIPREIEDSARIDGAGHLRILLQIVVPLSGPAISALAIFTFQAAWNEFFWTNLFLTSADRMTLPVGIVSLQGQYGGGSSFAIFAAASMIVFPTLILFTFTQRFLTESIARTGIKG
ncbi:MAG TPA: carbohydrate ABC transporter permease [Thermomicrobiales bacterium]|nr:carbohydrate ABC transporter permease [Thermomicrobiales bacterium]